MIFLCSGMLFECVAYVCKNVATYYFKLFWPNMMFFYILLLQVQDGEPWT